MTKTHCGIHKTSIPLLFCTGCGLSTSNKDDDDYDNEEERIVLLIHSFIHSFIKTSSSAVAKRPREASCLSVVSCNSTKRRVEYFIVSYVGYRFVTARCSGVFGVTLRLLVINILSSSPAINTAVYYQQ